MLEKVFGKRERPVERSEPLRICSTTSSRTAANPGRSACSCRISRDSSSGMPAPTIVASCRVKTTSSSPRGRKWFGLADVSRDLTAPPAPPPAAAGRTERTMRFLFRSSATAASWLVPTIVPVTALPPKFFASYLKLGMGPCARGLARALPVLHGDAQHGLDGCASARRRAEPAAAERHHVVLERLLLDVL